jgi:hypothetical protein
MKESPILKMILLSTGLTHKVKLFRNNTGMAWQGESVRTYTEKGDRYTILKNARPIHAGLIKGSSDLIGWKEIEVTNQLVGKKIAVFVALEVKSEKGKASPEQITFLQNVKNAGGICGVARSVQDSNDILGE